jgi:hypothetical protein
MHAIDPRSDPTAQYIARVIADDPDCDYRCACALAELVGIRLEDG